MPADDAGGQSRMAEMIDPAPTPIALARGVDEGEIAWRTAGDEAPLKRSTDRFGVTRAHEAGARKGPPILDKSCGAVGADKLGQTDVLAGVKHEKRAPGLASPARCAANLSVPRDSSRLDRGRYFKPPR